MPAGQRGVKTKTDNGKRVANGKSHCERNADVSPRVKLCHPCGGNRKTNSTCLQCNQHHFIVQSAPDYERPIKDWKNQDYGAMTQPGKVGTASCRTTDGNKQQKARILIRPQETSLWRCRETMRFIVSTRGHDKRAACHVFDDKKT